METMRVELVETRKEKKNYLQGLISLVMLIVAILGIAVSYMLFSFIRDERAAQKAVQSNSLSHAVAHLNDDSLAIRIGALYELEELWLGTKRESEKLVSVLTPFMLEHLQSHELSLLPRRHSDDDMVGYRYPQNYLYPMPDTYLAGKILSDVYDKYGLSTDFSELEADSYYFRYLSDMQLQGVIFKEANLEYAMLRETNLREADLYDAYLKNAYLEKANLQGANLSSADLEHAVLLYADLEDANLGSANLQDADMRNANLKYANLQGVNLEGTDLSGAWLYGADLRYAENLTVEQLVDVNINDKTQLDPELRAAYDKLNDKRMEEWDAEMFENWTIPSGGIYLYEPPNSPAPVW